MAGIYAHKKGKSGSTHPVRTTPPSWVRYSDEEIKKIVVKLNKEGMAPSVIGTRLRDQYGVPDVKQITGKSITLILKENEAAPAYPEDLFSLMRRAVKIRKHMVNAPKDNHSLKGLRNAEMKILRLVKYYKRTGVLEPTWTYDPDTAAIIVSGGR